MHTNEHEAQHITPEGQSVFADLFSPEEAVAMEIRVDVLSGLASWLDESGISNLAAAKVIGVNDVDISNIQQGKINQFNLDTLIRLASRAGLHPRIELKAA